VKELSKAIKEDKETKHPYYSGRYHKLVTFLLAGERYAVQAELAKAILINPPIAPLINVPDYVIGLTNFRGQLLTIIDLRIRLNLPLLKADQVVVTVFQVDNLLLGLLVEEVEGFYRTSQARFQAVPTGLVKIDKEYLAEMAKVDGKVLVVLDIKKMISRTGRFAETKAA
jgi:chemotaxis signal transduction protein